MERHNRQLDAKGDEKAGVAEHLEGQPQGFGGNVSIGKAGGAVPLEAHGHPHHQDEQGTARGVEDEFGGCILPFLAPPDGQQQIDGNQLQLPGQKEEQHVLHGKHRHLAAAHGQHEHVKEPRLEGDGPGRQDGQAGDERGEQDEGHGEPVGAHGPTQPQFR